MAPLSPTLHGLTKRLRLAGIEAPELEARLLVTHALATDEAWLLAHGEIELDPDQAARLDALVEARLAGQPMSQILGSVPFCDLSIHVTHDVLSPRPETELLVERIVEQLHRRPSLRIIDVGTGSGCIALALAHHLLQATVVGCDVSDAALDVARSNADSQIAESARRPLFVHSDLLTGVSGPFDLIVANLPYLTTAEMAAMPVELTYEPALALDGGTNGNTLIEGLLLQSPRHLAPGGAVALELHPHNVERTIVLAQQLFPGAHVEAWTDLGAVQRFVWVEIPPTQPSTPSNDPSS